MSTPSPVLPVAPAAPARDPGIDLLRGLSIVLVVLHHTGLRIGLKHSVLAPLLPKWFLDAFIWNGPEAVYVFFVISGFLIASNTIARWGSLAAVDLRAFYRRRAARILPPLLILLAVLAAFHWAGFEDWRIEKPQTLARALFAALALHLNWYEAATGWLPANWDVLWSLSIEELFYLGFPVACVLLGRGRLMVPLLALLALSMPFARAAAKGNEIWYEKATLPGMAAIAVGVLAALLLARRPTMPRRTATLALALGIVGIACVVFFEREMWRPLGESTMLVLAGCTAATLLALRWRAATGASAGTGAMRASRAGTGAMRASRAGAGAWLRSFGRLSYEVYLTHMFVVWPVVYAWQASGSGASWGFLFYLPALAGSWALGWLVARTISGPCERWLMRGPARRRGGDNPPSTVQPRSA